MSRTRRHAHKRGHETSPVAATKKSRRNGTGTMRKAEKYEYLSGFGGHFSSEALKDALPVGQNTPQKCPYGLIAEQLSGTSFTTPRVHNQRSWLYRIHPSCKHTPFKPVKGHQYLQSDFSKAVVDPNQLRWKPFPLPADDQKVDFIDGLKTLGGAGSPDVKTGFAIHIYTCNESMTNKAFYSADGDFLIVPQQGVLTIRTEFGVLEVEPQEICVIQRAIKFSVAVDGPSRGYICELYDGHFVIPDLGPIGANGLANPRDFKSPVAAYETEERKYKVVQKFLGELFETTMDFSPFNVVAWHGNYVPYKYDLRLFNTINSVSYDHIDPSIFTVLTCQTNSPGVAALDFVVFPPRWAVQDRTFRPPYYHRNVMSEFMGNIAGQYDAKPTGFAPGSGSLHSIGIGHGPSAEAFKEASQMKLKPVYMADQMAFMFESTYFIKLTKWAHKQNVDKDYHKCWKDIDGGFDENKK